MAKAQIPVIYEDSEIIVVNKPSGVAVTKDRAGDIQLLPVLAAQQALGKLLLVHRLDKETSGVMVIAKSTAAQRKYTEYFVKGYVKKTYLAIVSGSVLEKTGTIDAPIGPDRRNPRAMAVVSGKLGKKATTNWFLLADFGHAALLSVSPVTGRTHQIRVHLPHAGMPLAVDPLYGSSQGLMLSAFKPNYRLGKFQEEKPLIDRLTLHAYQIEFTEIQPDRPVIFVAGLDKHFAAAVKMLTKHSIRKNLAFADPAVFETILAARPLPAPAAQNV